VILHSYVSLPEGRQCAVETLELPTMAVLELTAPCLRVAVFAPSLCSMIYDYDI
jgi:hypothetical protein